MDQQEHAPEGQRFDGKARHLICDSLNCPRLRKAAGRPIEAPQHDAFEAAHLHVFDASEDRLHGLEPLMIGVHALDARLLQEIAENRVDGRVGPPIATSANGACRSSIVLT
ncbi:MAG: hypothetical protein WAN86_26625 [Hyphomicrobiaceae bacterium]